MRTALSLRETLQFATGEATPADESDGSLTKPVSITLNELECVRADLSARFIDDAEGLSALLDFLAAMDYVTLQSPIHTAALSCLKALMNNSVSLQLQLTMLPF